jgi:taurine--2-oxoglutarate transaminase
VGKLFYTVSGAESVENALKIARQVTQRPLVLARHKSYHGASLGAMSVSGDWRSDAHLTFAAGTLRIPEPADDPNATGAARVIEAAGPESIAAIIVEPISGTNGVHIPPQTWVDGIQYLCRQHGIKIIIDEVFCGFGRTGPDFAFQAFGWNPDLVCLSKAISGGYIPFGAVWASPEIAQYYQDQTLVCGLTNYAHPLGLAALEGVLDILDSEIYQSNKTVLAETFASGLSQLAERLGQPTVRCRGLLAAVEWSQWTLPTWQQFLEVGLYVFTKQNMLILAPPLVSQPARLRAAFDSLIEFLSQARESRP